MRKKENPKKDLKFIGVRVQPFTETVIKKVSSSLGSGASMTSSAEQLLDSAAQWLSIGEKSALKSISAEEKKALIWVVNSWWIVPLSTITPETLAYKVEEYLSAGNEGFFFGWSEEEKNNLCTTLFSLAPSESLALILWAKRFWEQDTLSVEEYILGA